MSRDMMKLRLSQYFLWRDKSMLSHDMSFMSRESNTMLLYLEAAIHEFSVGLLVQYFEIRHDFLLLSFGRSQKTYSMKQSNLPGESKKVYTSNEP